VGISLEPDVCSCGPRVAFSRVVSGIVPSVPRHAKLASLAALSAALGLAWLGPAAAAGASSHSGGGKDTVEIRGTAYAFDDQDPIAGATIRARGVPGAATTSRANGRYVLEVPDDAKLTPYIEADGFHGIFLQTFVTDGRDLRRVNFQVPSEGIYQALAALLDVGLDPDGDPARCAIVSTASTVNVRELGFAEFVAYGAHGVAGATASTSPALPGPIYFNESVIPDSSLTQTSVDGGIIWTEVPRGTYTVTAFHPVTSFASFRATCRDGRIVNANPPWGLHELKPGEKARGQPRR
jgi:hypothetical protein